jgi:hypothetical protein
MSTRILVVLEKVLEKISIPQAKKAHDIISILCVLNHSLVMSGQKEKSLQSIFHKVYSIYKFSSDFQFSKAEVCEENFLINATEKGKVGTFCEGKTKKHL